MGIIIIKHIDNCLFSIVLEKILSTFSFILAYYWCFTYYLDAFYNLYRDN